MKPRNADFKILGTIAKAYEEEGRLYVTGLASGTEIDRESERMAATAIKAFERSIDEGMVVDGLWSRIPLRSGHRGEWDDVLGWIVGCEVDEQFNFYITAELDLDNPQAVNLYKKLTRPAEEGKALRLGFSIGGKVLAAGEEYDPESGQYIFVYRDVKLDEVSVTSRPAYAPSYVFALYKSVDWDAVKGHKRVDFKEETVEEENQAAEVAKTEDAVVEEAAVAKTEDTVADEAAAVEKTEDAAVEEAPAEAEVAKTDEPAVEEAVEKDASDAAEVEETDPLADLRATVASLAETVAGLASAFEEIKKAAAEAAEADAAPEAEAAVEEEQVATDAPAEKAAEVEGEEGDPVAKADADEDLLERITKAVAAAIAPLQEQNAALLKRVEAMEAEPVDRSIAKSAALEAPAVDPEIAFRDELKGITKAADAIELAFKYGASRAKR